MSVLFFTEEDRAALTESLGILRKIDRLTSIATRAMDERRALYQLIALLCDHERVPRMSREHIWQIVCEFDALASEVGALRAYETIALRYRASGGKLSLEEIRDIGPGFMVKDEGFDRQQYTYDGKRLVPVPNEAALQVQNPDSFTPKDEIGEAVVAYKEKKKKWTRPHCKECGAEKPNNMAKCPNCGAGGGRFKCKQCQTPLITPLTRCPACRYHPNDKRHVDPDVTQQVAEEIDRALSVRERNAAAELQSAVEGDRDSFARIGEQMDAELDRRGAHTLLRRYPNETPGEFRARVHRDHPEVAQEIEREIDEQKSMWNIGDDEEADA